MLLLNAPSRVRCKTCGVDQVWQTELLDLSFLHDFRACTIAIKVLTSMLTAMPCAGQCTATKLCQTRCSDSSKLLTSLTPVLSAQLDGQAFRFVTSSATGSQSPEPVDPQLTCAVMQQLDMP